MAMAIRWKLKFGNGEWQWPFTGNGIFGSMNGQVAIRHKKWPFVFLAIRLPGPHRCHRSTRMGFLYILTMTKNDLISVIIYDEKCIQFSFSVDNHVFMNNTLLLIGLIVLTRFFFSERNVNYWKWIFWKTINIRIIRISEIANCRTWTIDQAHGITTKKGLRGDKCPMGNN